MAEAAGLAVGVFALAGTLKECVDLYSYISTARSLGRDFELLSVRLDIEMTLLSQWALRVKLFEKDYDHRLRDASIANAVSKILASIRVLLSDGEKLTSRYGLCKLERSDESDATPNFLSRHPLKQVADAFSRLKIHAHNTQQRATVLSAVRWAVKDKEKFEDLVLQLSELVGKLKDLVPESRTSSNASIGRSIRQIGSASDLRLVLDASTGYQSEVAEVAHQRLVKVCEERILRRIWFRFMEGRKSNVASPHPETLAWAFNHPDGRVKWDSLSKWLQESDGIYWVSGKVCSRPFVCLCFLLIPGFQPGSGKSTFMKYICDNEHTKKLLLAWSQGTPCILSNFFFWYRGRPEHRSQDGLSRALLYNILSNDRSLIPAILPSMWHEAYNASEDELAMPSPTELQHAFEILTGLQTSHRFCFIIDGLDEYEGDYRIGIKSPELLASNPHIKVVVSSRPIPECFQAFSRHPQLHMHDLNDNDILAYVQATVGDLPQMKDLRELSCGSSDVLLRGIVEKASGVFLWVVLACRSLAEGLGKGDGLSDLLERLDELPPELEQMFDYILGKIEKRYIKQAAQLLRICFALEENNLAGSGFSYPMPAVGLSILDAADMDLTKTLEFARVPHHSRDIIDARFGARLRSRCWGLLELCASNLETAVFFMHRTLYDYLATGRVWEHPALRIDDTKFDVFGRLSFIYLWSCSEAFKKNGHCGLDAHTIATGHM